MSIARAMPFADAIELGQADGGFARGPRPLGEARHQGVAVLPDAVRFFAEQSRDLSSTSTKAARP